MQHSSRILADRGWQVLFIGTHALGAEILRFPDHTRIEVRKMPYCTPGWKQKLHFMRFCLWCLWSTVRFRPDFVYASDPFSCPAASLIHFLTGKKIIYHEHDSPSATPTSLFLKACARFRKLMARTAHACVLPNSRRAQIFQQSTQATSPVFTVWNCPSKEEIAKPRSESTQGLRLYYHGSLAAARLPLALIEALALLPQEVTLTVLGYSTIGAFSFPQDVQRTAENLGVSKRLKFVPPQPRSSAMDICTGSDIGICFMPPSSDDINMRFMVGASNKAFDYLSRGLALLVSDLPDWIETFVKPGYGLACNPNDASSIAQALRRFLEDPAEMRAMGERGQRQIQREWNYETQFTPIAAMLSDGLLVQSEALANQ